MWQGKTLGARVYAEESVVIVGKASEWVVMLRIISSPNELYVFRGDLSWSVLTVNKSRLVIACAIFVCNHRK